MPRALSLRSRTRIQDRIKSAPDDLGAQLAAMMLKHNIPASAVAELCEVIPDTVYRWMYIGGCNHVMVQTLLRSMERIAAAHPEEFPLKGPVDERTLTLLTVLAEHG